MPPGYIPLHSQGLLALRAKAARRLLRECSLCPRLCGIDRLENETGYCGIGRKARVASASLHFGEEGCLVGAGGSGTIFFSGCNLGCVFCQNQDISRHPDSGREVTPRQLAAIMLDLQAQGAHNINLVTPSHVAAQILEALPIAVDGGLSLPLVYNSSAYDSPDTLALLQGVVDIYMPDVKFWDPDTAGRLCGAQDYPAVAKAAVKAMHGQAGDLVLDGSGLAVRGLLVRHLVLPEGLSGTDGWMRFLANDVSPRTYVNVMDQYRPCADARKHPPLDRSLTGAEYRMARQKALDAGLTRLDERKPATLERMLVRMMEGRGKEDA